MIRARHLAGFVGTGLLCVLPPDASVAAEPGPLAQEEMIVTCGPAPRGHRIRGKRDYRQRDANVLNQRDFKVFEWTHLAPARARVNAVQNLDYDVMNNLDFVLSKAPNHEPALRILIDWDLIGGKHHEAGYKPPACYFIWAAQFAPDDSVVWNYGGYYFHRKGDTRRAMQWWQQALVVDPSNSEVHNTLGLIAFDEGDYERAREHAWAAYAAGYPLPTLRDKLKSAGQWRDPPPGTASNGQ
jgi:tetratricopeptide (TPR) repeat protein